MSEKRDKFVRLAEARVNRALKDIQLVGNLSNQAAYDYDEEDVRKIFSALSKALSSAKARFGADDGAGGDAFKLN